MPVYQLYQHHFINIDSQRLHYLSAGSEHAEAVVLLAGFPQQLCLAGGYSLACQPLSCDRTRPARAG